MKIYQAVFKWRDKNSNSFYSTEGAAKASFDEPDPITGRPRVGGDRIIYEWKLNGEQFFCVAAHFFAAGAWTKPGEWVRAEGVELPVWVKASGLQKN